MFLEQLSRPCRLFLGRECPYQCLIRYTGEWGDFQVDVESNDLSGIKLLRQECITLDEANISSTLAESQGKTKISDFSRNNRVLALTFEPTGKLSETVSGSIVLKTNVPSYERFTLRVSGTIKSPVQAFPGTIDLADGEEHQVTLVSLVDEPLHVTGIDCDDAITCRHTASVTEKEQTLYFKQTGKPTSNQLNVKFRLNSEESETTLPLTLIDHAF